MSIKIGQYVINDEKQFEKDVQRYFRVNIPLEQMNITEELAGIVLKHFSSDGVEYTSRATRIALKVYLMTDEEKRQVHELLMR